MFCLAVPYDDDERALDGGDAAVLLQLLRCWVVALDHCHEVLVRGRVPGTSATPPQRDLGSTCANWEIEIKIKIKIKRIRAMMMMVLGEW